MVQPGDPRERALDADPEAGVRHAAVAAQVLVPLEGLLRQALLLDAARQQLERGHALAAADDLAVALRGQAVAGEAEPGVRGVGLHVEGLDRAPGSSSRTAAWRTAARAPSRPAPRSRRPTRRRCPRRAGARPPRCSGCGRRAPAPARARPDVALDDLELLGAALEDAPHHGDQQALLERDHVLERREGPLRLHHPELDQVPARLALLGAEGRAEAVDAPERQRRGLLVELAALRQVGLLVEVLGLEQRARALARVRREDRRVHQQEALAVHEVAQGADQLRPDPQDGVLPRTSAATGAGGPSGSRCRAPWA